MGVMLVAGLLILTVQAKIKTDRSKLNQLAENLTAADRNVLNRRILEVTIKTYRTWCYLLTTISILAVDFHVFPRSQAKTENFGLSLMDTGVGLFIVCHSMKLSRKSPEVPAPTDQQSDGLFKCVVFLFSSLSRFTK